MDLATDLVQILVSQSSKETTANEILDAVSAAAIFGRDADACTGLVFGGYGGRVNGTAVSNWTVTATASNTNYVVVHRTTFAVSVATANTNWNNTGTYARLYKLTAGTSSITDYEDHRFGDTGALNLVASGGASDFAGDSGSGGTHGLVPAPAAGDAADNKFLSADGTWKFLPVTIALACSDETTALTTGTAKATFRMPHAMTLTEVRASLTTASGSGNPAIDVNKNGSSIFSTTLTIDSGEKTSKTAATAAVLSTTALSDDDEITVDIDTAGSSAAGLKITLIGTYA